MTKWKKLEPQGDKCEVQIVAQSGNAAVMLARLRAAFPLLTIVNTRKSGKRAAVVIQCEVKL